MKCDQGNDRRTELDRGSEGHKLRVTSSRDRASIVHAAPHFSVHAIHEAAGEVVDRGSVLLGVSETWRGDRRDTTEKIVTHSRATVAKGMVYLHLQVRK